MPLLPAKTKILLILAKSTTKLQLNFSRSALFHMKTRVSLKYFATDCGLTFSQIWYSPSLFKKVMLSTTNFSSRSKPLFYSLPAVDPETLTIWDGALYDNCCNFQPFTKVAKTSVEFLNPHMTTKDDS